MLLGNYSNLNSNPGRNFGGFTNPYDWMKYSGVIKFYYGESTVTDVTNKSSFNNGYVPPYSWALAPNAGGMAMSLSGTGTITSDLVPQYLAIANFTGSGGLAASIIGYGNVICALTGSSSFTASLTGKGNVTIDFTGNGNISANISATGQLSVNLTGAGSLSAGASLFLNMVCAMTGSGSMSADASLLVSMLCAMSGGGSLSASISGIKSMTCSMTGSGDLDADMTAFGNMIISMIGSGDLDADINAVADMSIDIVVTGTGLTTSNVGASVWQAILSQYSSDPNSAAAKLLGASSAGDPWSTELPASYTGDQAGNILSQIQTLIDELHKIQGLNVDAPMTVTQTTRVAGDIEQEITGDGSTTTTVTRI